MQKRSDCIRWEELLYQGTNSSKAYRANIVAHERPQAGCKSGQQERIILSGTTHGVRA